MADKYTHVNISAHRGDVIVTMVRGTSFVTDAFSIEEVQSISDGLIAQIAIARDQLAQETPKADE